jgi:hypothetical protein
MQKIEQTLSERTSYDHKKLNSFNSHKTIRNPKSVNQVDGIVAKLISTFHSESHTPLFRKVGWYLSEAVINNAVEASARANSPLAYFITCMKRELSKAGK